MPPCRRARSLAIAGQAPWPVAPLLLAALALALPPAGRAGDRHVLWAVQGRENTVYLLGSVHVLRPGDAALPAAAEHAFDDAEQLVMEIDLDAPGSDPLAMATEMQQSALLPAGQTLHGVLGSDYTAINEQARAAGFELEAFDAFAPWFVAIALLDLELASRGFSSENGIEQTLAARAIADHKPIEGLETAEQQFQMLAGLPMEQQKRFLVMTLDESARLDRELDELLRAWQSGDAEALARLLSTEYEQFPDLYRRLTVDRNRAWAGRLAELLADRDDYLVVVGALHLVGPGQRRGPSATARLPGHAAVTALRRGTVRQASATPGGTGVAGALARLGARHPALEPYLSLYTEACKVIPGGVNSPVRAFRGVGGKPIFFAKAQGPACLGGRRPRVHRLRRLVGADDPRPCAPGGDRAVQDTADERPVLRRADRARDRRRHAASSSSCPRSSWCAW